jgi:hypothetical protein
MIDPVTGAALGTVGGGLTLLNSMVKIYQDHKKNPKSYPPAMAELIAALPAMALKLTGEFIAEIEKLRRDCLTVGIDLNLTHDQLQEATSFYQRSRRKLLKDFQTRVEGIVGVISIFFDDFVAVANCCDKLDVLSRSFADSRKQKIALRKGTTPDLPLGTILDNLQKHAEDLRAEIGDLG